jgi:hypothetical protein
MSVIGRLFGRSRKLAVPEPELEPALVHVAPEPDIEEADWEWRMAAARVAGVTEPTPQPPVSFVHARTVIPVPALPVARDPSMVRLRQETERNILPPRTRFARGTSQHVHDDDDTARIDIRRRFAR